jgi:peptidoglycan hydrolase-like protein with peptidoglycan-binding domain
MRIVISSGHGKHVSGAVGPAPWGLNEVDEARRVVEKVAEYLNNVATMSCVTFHDDVSKTQNENLNRIVAFHNAQARELDVSVHFNANVTTSSPMGTECLYVTDADLARTVASAVAQAGQFINRGPKKRTDLFFLNNTEEPAVLVETCFVDSSADVDLYHQHFDAICRALAGTLGGQPVEEPIPPEPERPDDYDPTDVPVSQRPVLREGSSGRDVMDLQMLLPRFDGAVDGDFGNMTEVAVLDYQRTRGLMVDGLVGEETWTALYGGKPPLPPPVPPPAALSVEQTAEICRIANNSVIARYEWRERGQAPRGYTQGMAVAFAQSYRKLMAGHPAVAEMARARTDSDKDALNIYKVEFQKIGLSNERSGVNTLRHLYALMIGHGMRESSGRYCEGRDTSASNVSSETAEAGLFQTSYNAHSASDPHFTDLMNEFEDDANRGTCYLGAFEDGVACDSSDWANYGSGAGAEFQELCKTCPSFAVESAGLTLRNLCNHYGPIVRKEVELRRAADNMLKQVQQYIDSEEPIA